MRAPTRFGGISIALAFASLLGAPAGAWAKEGLDLTLHFPASKGYRITVGGYGSTAFIKASESDGPPHRRAWSTYIARGKVSSTAIHARFGDLGSVAMRFRPSGRITHSRRHHGCIGPDRYTIRFGTFVGSVRFRGEGGYTSTRVHRVKGRAITPRLLACLDLLFGEIRQRGSRRDGKGESAKATRLEAYFRSGLTAMLFAASERGGKAGFLVQSEQSVGSLAIFRGAFVRASPLTFAFDNALSFAGVTPPAPFSGTASLRRDPRGRRTWAGSLAVSFPGAPDVPLTGPQFRTQLTQSW